MDFFAELTILWGMTKVQTRRCVSLKREVYDRIKNYCELNHISMSSFVEAALMANVPSLLEAAKVKETPVPSRGLPISAPPAKRPPGNVASF
jgi:hypothetical protein